MLGLGHRALRIAGETIVVTGLKMLKFLKKWLSGSDRQKTQEPMDLLRKTGSHRNLKPSAAPTPRKPVQRSPSTAEGDEKVLIRDDGPGKNVLVRKRFVREDTGTHETLKILDDSMIEDDEESGIDPYNTGRFDRSKYWDKRFRK